MDIQKEMEESMGNITKGLEMNGQHLTAVVRTVPSESRPEGELRWPLVQAALWQPEAITPHLTKIASPWSWVLRCRVRDGSSVPGPGGCPERQMCNRELLLPDNSLTPGSSYYKVVSFPTIVNITHLFRRTPLIVTDHWSRESMSYWGFMECGQFCSKKRVGHSENWPRIWQYSLWIIRLWWDMA